MAIAVVAVVAGGMIANLSILMGGIVVFLDRMGVVVEQ